SDRLTGPEGDALHEALAAEFPAALFVSATTGAGIDQILARLAELAASEWKRVKVVVPYAAGALVQRVRERGSLRNTAYSEAGIEIEADVPPDLASELTHRQIA